MTLNASTFQFSFHFSFSDLKIFASPIFCSYRSQYFECTHVDCLVHFVLRLTAKLMISPLPSYYSGKSTQVNFPQYIFVDLSTKLYFSTVPENIPHGYLLLSNWYISREQLIRECYEGDGNQLCGCGTNLVYKSKKFTVCILVTILQHLRTVPSNVQFYGTCTVLAHLLYTYLSSRSPHVVFKNRISFLALW